MSIVSPNLPLNLFIQPSNLTGLPSDLRQLSLRLDQVVRATVVDGGLDRAFLELYNQQFRAEADRELQVGQQLRLQVTKLSPRLEFNVLTDTPKDKLSQLLPVLSRPYDWSTLIGKLQDFQSPKSELGQEYAKVFQQLRTLLDPAGRIEMDSRENVHRIIQLLNRVAPGEISRNILNRGATSAPGFLSPLPVVETVSSPVDKIVFSLVQKLHVQLAEVRALPDTQKLPAEWLNTTRTLLSPLNQGGLLLSASTSSTSMQPLMDVLNQLQLQPRVTPQLALELEHIIADLGGRGDRSQNAEIVAARVGRSALHEPFASPGRDIPGDTGMPLGVRTQPLLPSSREGGQAIDTAVVTKEVVPQLKDEITQLVRLVREQRGSLSPELVGRLEGLIQRLQQVAPAGVHEAVGSLTQLLSQAQLDYRAPQLGILSQLFGFHLETELLKGKTKLALTNLKMALLDLRKELADDVSEPLRRLELFQLCKARLAEDQVQFLPLPFPQLEEGYLLAEQQGDGVEIGKERVNLSLSLRLSALGNMRVDMLYHPDQGLQLQVAGETLEKKAFLESCSDEFCQSIKNIRVQDIRFSADARLPTKQLQERLLPEASGMLDERI